jgi:hypothetical protein
MEVVCSEREGAGCEILRMRKMLIFTSSLRSPYRLNKFSSKSTVRTPPKQAAVRMVAACLLHHGRRARGSHSGSSSGAMSTGGDVRLSRLCAHEVAMTIRRGRHTSQTLEASEVPWQNVWDAEAGKR